MAGLYYFGLKKEARIDLETIETVILTAKSLEVGRGGE